MKAQRYARNGLRWN